MMNINEIKNMYQKGDLLNIAAYSAGTRALGPGLRAAVWMQGCPRHCFNCIAPDWLAMRENQLISPTDLMQKLVEQPVRGLTISGGDPMLQAAGLAALITQIRKHRELDVICFTGYQYTELLGLNNHSINALLSVIDVLIDGPYIDALNDNQGMRGSSNQKVIHFSDRLKDYDFHKQPRKLEITVRKGSIFAIGVPETKMKTALDQFSENIVKIGKNPGEKENRPSIKIRTEKKNERA